MIYLFLAPGFEEVEALAPLDLLRRAGLSVTTVGIGGKTVTGAHGITVTADITDLAYTDLKDPAPEMVILPGGMPGSLNLDASPVVDAAIRAAVKNDGYLCAICAAPLILGRRGLLKGRRATCYPGFEEELVGAIEIGGKVIRDGKIITATGMGVALEFGLELVSVLKDPATAGKIKDGIRA
ncbi:MAG: DJ-1/PfpI family protein [Ruminococcaceae bacterium]|nr:DJ-1/PfpI family protein [Oscillospiraceae bacterium]